MDIEKRKEEAIESEYQDTFAQVHDQDTEDENTVSDLYAEFITPLGTKISDLFDEAERDRRNIEQEWIEDLRQYRGQYSPEVAGKFHPNRSKAFLSITKTKTKTVTARMVDILFPSTGRKNWNIRPSAIPDLGPQLIDDIVHQFTSQTGQSPSHEDIKMVIFQEAKERCDKMGKAITDQLEDLQYREIIRRVVHSGNLFGTGVLKGPLAKRKVAKRWATTQDGWAPIHIESVVPYCEWIPIWDFYPDMSAQKFKDVNYVFQRHVMSAPFLYGLANRSDFNATPISNYLKAHPDGTATRRQFEIDLRSISQDGDNLSGGQTHLKGRYEVLEFWGFLTAEELREAGVQDIPDGQEMVAANVWVLDGMVIKAVLSPLEGVTFPYYLYYFDKDETSIFGEGIPRSMRDSQSLFNASVRAMLDNAAISAGPLIEANVDLLEPDEDARDLFPFRVFLRGGEGVDASAKAVNVTSLPTYVQEYMAMVEFFLNSADEVTSVPRYLHGGAAGVGGAGDTARGLSMLMGQANITLKDQIKFFDDGVTSLFIKSMYFWNMDFNPDPGIKGDFEVVAEGSTSLIAKEVQAENLINFLAMTNNELDVQFINRAEALRLVAKSMDLDDLNLIKTPEVVQSEQEARARQEEEDKAWTKQIEEMKAQSGGHYKPEQQSTGGTENLTSADIQRSQTEAPYPLNI